MPNTKEKKQISRSKFWARILCLFLALVMIGSMAYLAINLIVQSVKEKKDKEAASTTAAIIPAESITSTLADTVYIDESYIA